MPVGDSRVSGLIPIRVHGLGSDLTVHGQATGAKLLERKGNRLQVPAAASKGPDGTRLWANLGAGTTIWNEGFWGRR